MLAAWLPAASWAATPTLSGLYRAQEAGVLLFTTEDDRVSGKYVSGGACAFEADQRIIEGRFEGNVLVGSVLLCQTGAACPPKVYPWLAVYHPVSGTLFGEVKLDAACTSPALAGTRLLVSALAAGERPSAGKLSGSSAALIAKKKSNGKKNLELHKDALLKGKRLLEAGDFAGAAQQFAVGISYNESNWTAYFGLGVAEFKRGNVLKAIASYERARELARNVRQNEADISYNLACAHSRLGDKKAALAHLKSAVKQGFSLPEAMSSDADLIRLFQDDPEFKKLVAQAWSLKARKGGGSF
ncbi:MAG: tetratricopeptide repeat protein [Myxococcota bacterium]